MRAHRSRLQLTLALALIGACSSGEYRLERRGGPFPATPVTDPPSDGAGGSEASGGAPGAAGDGGGEPIAFCDALLVVRSKCQRCHGDPLQNGAPAAFLVFDDFHRRYYETEFEWWEIASRAVSRGFMPYTALNDPPTSLMPPVEPLTAAERATLLGWLERGALPTGGTDCP